MAQTDPVYHQNLLEHAGEQVPASMRVFMSAHHVAFSFHEKAYPTQPLLQTHNPVSDGARLALESARLVWIRRDTPFPVRCRLACYTGSRISSLTAVSVMPAKPRKKDYPAGSLLSSHVCAPDEGGGVSRMFAIEKADNDALSTLVKWLALPTAREQRSCR